MHLLSNLGCGNLFADGDGGVDQADFAALQLCVTGSGFAGELSSACGCFDRDNNAVIDQSDVAAFDACASGPDVPLDPSCDD